SAIACSSISKLFIANKNGV
ncbi:hypothetical protein D050_2654B, partial [Vibrio parahaemolyticus VPCR-2009]